jgi:hypothetical protein
MATMQTDGERMAGRPMGAKWPPRCWHMIDEIDLVRLMAEHSDWLRLCARLESIADGLPSLPQADDVRLLRAQVEGLIGTPARAEERTIDALFVRERVRPLARNLLDGFRLARAARVIDAQDILAALEARGDGGNGVSATALGYMMRSFFQGCRDAVVIEQLGLFALGKDRLTADARALLLERLTESCGLD